MTNLVVASPTNWREHVGLGERQPRDERVTDLTRTRRVIVEGEHTPNVGLLVEHRSGRVDAVVNHNRDNPSMTVHADPDMLLDLRRMLGLSRAEMLGALNSIFGVQVRRLIIK